MITHHPYLRLATEIEISSLSCWAQVQAENLERRALIADLRAENSELRHTNAEFQQSNPPAGLAVLTTMRWLAMRVGCA